MHSLSSTVFGCIFGIGYDDIKNQTYKSIELNSIKSIELNPCKDLSDKSKVDTTEHQIFCLSSTNEKLYCRFPDLLHFRVVQVGLVEVCPSDFKGLKKLEFLDLSHNKLRIIQNGTFDDLNQLLNLTLKNNSISRIDKGTFKNLVLLKNLDMSDNRLTSLEAGLFSTNLKIVTIDFLCNDLRFIPWDLFKNLPEVQVVHLGLNGCENINGTSDACDASSIKYSTFLGDPVSSHEKSEKGVETMFIEILFRVLFGDWR